MNLTWNGYPSQIGHGGPDPGSDQGPVLPLPRWRPPHGRRRGALLEVRICHEVVAKDELPEDLPDELRPLLHL